MGSAANNEPAINNDDVTDGYSDHTKTFVPFTPALWHNSKGLPIRPVSFFVWLHVSFKWYPSIQIVDWWNVYNFFLSLYRCLFVYPRSVTWYVKNSVKNFMRSNLYRWVNLSNCFFFIGWNGLPILPKDWKVILLFLWCDPIILSTYNKSIFRALRYFMSLFSSWAAANLVPLVDIVTQTDIVCTFAWLYHLLFLSCTSLIPVWFTIFFSDQYSCYG